MEPKGKSVSLSAAAAAIVDECIEKVRRQNPSRTKKISPSEAIEVAGRHFLDVI